MSGKRRRAPSEQPATGPGERTSGRRAFLRACAGAAAAAAGGRLRAAPPARVLPARAPWSGPQRPRESALLAALRAGDPAVRALLAPRAAAPAFGAAPGPAGLRDRFSDLPRHFVFEYYPWYQSDPWRHWTQWDRVPPDDIAANHVPRLGPYDSRSAAVIEQHARWVADAGAGAVNLSWWGPGSAEDLLVPLVMDVMRDHGIKVTFHLEPYADDHGARWQQDVLYLLREYGERRGYDCLLLLRDEDGSEGPVFKGFRTILPAASTDCRGVTREVTDYTPDDVYARQLDALRKMLRGAFDHVTLLADSLDFERAPRAGFDGVAVYDNFVPPWSYSAIAQRASEAGMAFSLNVNPGYDTIEPRVIEPGSCYEQLPFAPPADPFDWSNAEDRERAARLAEQRIAESLFATLAAQSDSGLYNFRNGFLLVYLTSFNEWHEGHAFEPMKDAAQLTDGERAFGYHNPARGDYRLRFLADALRSALAPVPPAPVTRVAASAA